MSNERITITNGGVKDYEIYIDKTGELIGNYKREISESDVKSFYSTLKLLGRTGKLIGYSFTPEAEKIAKDCYKATLPENKKKDQ